MEPPTEEEPAPEHLILITGRDLLHQERGDTVKVGEFHIRVDHSSVQDYPLTNHPHLP